jgi:hypothetical protein
MERLLARLDAHKADLPARYRILVEGVDHRVDTEFVGPTTEPYEAECTIHITHEAVDALLLRPGTLTLLRLVGEKQISADPPGLAVTLAQKLARWT